MKDGWGGAIREEERPMRKLLTPLVRGSGEKVGSGKTINFQRLMLDLNYTSIIEKFWYVIPGGNISFSHMDFFLKPLFFSGQ